MYAQWNFTRHKEVESYVICRKKDCRRPALTKNATYQCWDMGIRKIVRNAKTQVKIIKTETLDSTGRELQ